MRIAIDAMGGDHAPEVPLRGALKAAQEYPDLELRVYGRPDDLAPYLPENLPTNIQVLATEEVIGTAEEPVKALRQKKQSSLVLGLKAVRKDQADAFISAGNSGALMAGALMQVGRMKGISRPAFLVNMPCFTDFNKSWVLIDGGANVDNKPAHLHQYALMGSAYMRAVKGIDQPRIGLLNNGKEAGKGNQLTQAAYELLSQEENIHFIGNVEPSEVLNDACDVVVADGFAANMVLKSLEGASKAFVTLLSDTLKTTSWKSKLAGLLVKEDLKQTFAGLNSDNIGAGVVFGVKQPVLKCHGSAKDDAFYYAILQARQMVQSQLYDQLAQDFEALAQADQAKKEDD
ncbi:MULTISPECIES: phosphate acyltransferase PlsX [Aerococcus]|uniref:Phosphate acyltransferase n=1 Tax=Aerococcus sanguinicola TaxID=119206 RepID=A0A5N1GIN5_9LACT|nr:MULTISPECIES: phosphate acyltransferase PlsX [Aerococcus]KAA9300803.1 phosphate acyltransferase PlsX [Aerococcus sanguinicola]MDK6369408.1 phosphate acyltransferase PlsX [Aerococcus sp. UMB9870]MDK6679910.1 phosphate acyltransferase PlsX [Aerococcus sp. UMB8608]MDK6686729.1 phosphate acyltransferase PlsX [Aerococcus sp. UMB8623]MDK6939832.1 phosphate acyltransferase PlsX [Aerococcus sp. UMB8487]